MAKIAVDLERALARRDAHGTVGRTTGRVLAHGDGWTVEDVICTSGPQDRPFEEQHSHVAVAVVVAGTFQYRSTAGRGLMTPGSLLLGNPGQCFECGHEHGAGDRCISFRYTADYFERASGVTQPFRVPHLPALRETSPIIAAARAGLVGSGVVSWEELAVRLAGEATRIAGRRSPVQTDAPPSVVARVTRAVRAIEQPAARLTLAGLAREAGLSPFHFLRTFERLTGVTPHQYVLRARLREAATRLTVERARVIDVAFDCGFGDVSNFNRAFRAEFGVSPRDYRRLHGQARVAPAATM